VIEKYVNTEELKRLISSLIIFVGALVIAALFAVIVVPGLRNANRPPAPTPVDPVVGEPGWLNPAEFPPQRGREIPPVDAQALIAGSPELIERGKARYTKDCAACHGELGRGDGPAAMSMNPRPRDFTAPNGWTNGNDLASIYRTVTEGVKGTSMAPFDYLPKTDRMALAHYVQSLGTFQHAVASTEAMRLLSEELAAAGGKTSNKIPVSMAIERVMLEYKPVAPLKLDAAGGSAGADLLRAVVIDPSRAAVTLAGAPGWRSGVKELAAAITEGCPGNGFAAGVATLSPSEWRTLHAKLLEILGGSARREM
jgi:mono/diheme cytochrome c family protein